MHLMTLVSERDVEISELRRMNARLKEDSDRTELEMKEVSEKLYGERAISGKTIDELEFKVDKLQRELIAQRHEDEEAEL